MRFFVYRILTWSDRKCYVGLSSNIEHRLSTHVSHQVLPLEGGFFFQVLACCVNKEDGEATERHFIAKYDCMAPKGHNKNFGGMHGRVHSEQTRQKLSQAAKLRPPRPGMPHTKNSLEKMRASHAKRKAERQALGLKVRVVPSHTKERIEKNRVAHLGQPAWNKGRPRTDEEKKSISEAIKARYALNPWSRVPPVLNAEQREAAAAKQRGKKQPESVREKMRAAHARRREAWEAAGCPGSYRYFRLPD